MYNNTDIDEMTAKLRRIRSVADVRYSMYDRVSKTQIYLDASLEAPIAAWHIAWHNKKGDGCLGDLFPQANFKNGTKTLKDALDIALTIARAKKLADYKLERYMRENEYRPGTFYPDYKIKEI